MPIPTKIETETPEEFVDRCMIDETMQEYDDDQRLAICIAQLEEDRAVNDIDLTPTKGMIEEAEKSLEWRKEYGRGGTGVGVGTANAIIENKITPDRVKRMYSYLSRHEVDKKAEGFNAGEDGYPSAGRIAWGLWGGDAAFTWSENKAKNIKMEENKDMENAPLETKTTKRHIENVEETEDSYIITFAKGEHHNEKEEVESIDEEIIEEEGIGDEEIESEEEYTETYRDVNNAEQRLFNSNIELRQEGDSTTVTGYAAVFNSRSENLGGFYEYIDTRAFNEVMEKTPDVRFLINHEGMPLGRTSAGTLRLSVDQRGLKYEVDLPNTQTANELKMALQRGDVNQSSFAFTVAQDSWKEENGEMRREILNVDRLLDVSAVTFPAYPSATVGLRSMEAWKSNQETVAQEKDEYKREENDLHKRSIRELKLNLIKSNLK